MDYSADPKDNCWEFMECGYHPGGSGGDGPGVCPASVYVPFDGVNGGKNGGRCCWRIKEAYCRNSLGDADDRSCLNCTSCGFFKYVNSQEGSAFTV